MTTKQFSHTDSQGKARMVNIGSKPNQYRRAVARGEILLQPETIRLITENQIAKGDVLTIARIAGIQAAKRTADLIPLCHPLLLSHIEVILQLHTDRLSAYATVETTGKTGVEMEALTAVSTCLLTVYDMCKAVDKTMVINNITLTEKTKTDAPA